MSDQDRISPNNNNTVSSRKVKRKKTTISKRGLSVDPTPNSQNYIIKVVQQMVRRITNEILEVKGLQV